jgi:ribosomal protein S18 acetylase RimI-like enzyme
MARTDVTDLRYRPAGADDVEAIAALHADSWRRNYRGAFSDAFLDGDVVAERLAVWTDRLRSSPAPSARTIVAVSGDGRVVGLTHVVLGDDDRWGALLDNLHVAHELRGQGVGSRLMAESARAVLDATPGDGLYLWVLEGNASARAFYEARGGVFAGREQDVAPGGGTVIDLRYAWPDPSVLLAGPAGT